MSPKELLYIEDALGHETQIQATCKDSSERLTDPELKGFVKQIGENHCACFTRFYNLLNQ